MPVRLYGLKSRLSIGSRAHKVVQFWQVLDRTLFRYHHFRIISRLLLQFLYFGGRMEIKGAGLQGKMALVFDTVVLTWILMKPLLLKLYFWLFEVKHWHSRSHSQALAHNGFHLNSVHPRNISSYNIRLNAVLLLEFSEITSFTRMGLNCFESLVIWKERLFLLSFSANLGREVMERGCARR